MRRRLRSIAVVVALLVAVLAASATSPPNDASATANQLWHVTDLRSGSVVEGQAQVDGTLATGWRRRSLELSVAFDRPTLARLLIVDDDGEPLSQGAAGDGLPGERLAVTYQAGDATHELAGTQSCSTDRCDEPVHVRMEVLQTDGTATAQVRVAHGVEAGSPDGPEPPEVTFARPAPQDEPAPDPTITPLSFATDDDAPIDARWVTVPEDTCASGPVHLTAADLPTGDVAQIKVSIGGHLDPSPEPTPASAVPLDCTPDPATRSFWVVLVGSPQPATAEMLILSEGGAAPTAETVPPDAAPAVTVTLRAGDNTAAEPLPAAPGATGTVLTFVRPRSIVPDEVDGSTVQLLPSSTPHERRASLARECLPGGCANPGEIGLQWFAPSPPTTESISATFDVFHVVPPT